MRRPHYLKTNDRNETIHHCVWYDTETREEPEVDGTRRHILVFGWAAYSRRIRGGKWSEPQWMRFTEGEQLWQWIDRLSKAKKTLYVWAHNHSFDWLSSCASVHLSHLRWDLTKAIVDCPPFVMTYKRSSAKLVLTDTLNIWRMSLKEMGRLTGLEKLSLPTSWSGVDSDDEYCRRDVEIIMRAVQHWADWLVTEDMGKMTLTVASQAMQAFRHKYLSERILIDTDADALRISRAAYHGGRVECFRIGAIRRPLYLLDINSLYPYVMATERFPLRLVATTRELSTIDVQHVLKQYLVCARVTCETVTPAIPLIVNGKLIFPVGRFDAYVSTPELQYLYEREQVLRVAEAAIYEDGRPFVSFVENLYERRIKAKTSGDLVQSGHYKLLLNSFYGKWGQNGVKWRDVGRVEDQSIGFWKCVNYDTGAVTHWRRYNGLMQLRDTEPESAQSHPAIAAHITAYARMILWALIRQATPEHCFYCDTDSILVDEQGFERVKERISESILGGLKVVGEYQQTFIYGCKDYVLDGKRTCKGIRDQAVEIDTNTYRQDKWIGLRGALRDGRLVAPRVRLTVKRLRRIYDKGLVGADGFVFPHSVLEWS